jgi:hypothetical protein
MGRREFRAPGGAAPAAFAQVAHFSIQFGLIRFYEEVEICVLVDGR